MDGLSVQPVRDLSRMRLESSSSFRLPRHATTRKSAPAVPSASAAAPGGRFSFGSSSRSLLASGTTTTPPPLLRGVSLLAAGDVQSNTWAGQVIGLTEVDAVVLQHIALQYASLADMWEAVEALQKYTRSLEAQLHRYDVDPLLRRVNVAECSPAYLQILVSGLQRELAATRALLAQCNLTQHTEFAKAAGQSDADAAANKTTATATLNLDVLAKSGLLGPRLTEAETAADPTVQNALLRERVALLEACVAVQEHRGHGTSSSTAPSAGTPVAAADMLVQVTIMTPGEAAAIAQPRQLYAQLRAARETIKARDAVISAQAEMEQHLSFSKAQAAAANASLSRFCLQLLAKYEPATYAKFLQTGNATMLRQFAGTSASQKQQQHTVDSVVAAAAAMLSQSIVQSAVTNHGVLLRKVFKGVILGDPEDLEPDASTADSLGDRSDEHLFEDDDSEDAPLGAPVDAHLIATSSCADCEDHSIDALVATIIKLLNKRSTVSAMLPMPALQQLLTAAMKQSAHSQFPELCSNAAKWFVCTPHALCFTRFVSALAVLGIATAIDSPAWILPVAADADSTRSRLDHFLTALLPKLEAEIPPPAPRPVSPQRTRPARPSAVATNGASASAESPRAAGVSPLNLLESHLLSPRGGHAGTFTPSRPMSARTSDRKPSRPESASSARRLAAKFMLSPRKVGQKRLPIPWSGTVLDPAQLTAAEEQLDHSNPELRALVEPHHKELLPIFLHYARHQNSASHAPTFDQIAKSNTSMTHGSFLTFAKECGILPHVLEKHAVAELLIGQPRELEYADFVLLLSSLAVKVVPKLHKLPPAPRTLTDEVIVEAFRAAFTQVLGGGDLRVDRVKLTSFAQAVLSSASADAQLRCPATIAALKAGRVPGVVVGRTGRQSELWVSWAEILSPLLDDLVNNPSVSAPTGAAALATLPAAVQGPVAALSSTPEFSDVMNVFLLFVQVRSSQRIS